MLESLRPFLTKILNPLAKHLNINGEITVTIFGFIFKCLASGFNIFVKKGRRLSSIIYI